MMGWPLTLGLAAVLLAFAAFCAWRGSRPPDFKRGPRMIPYRALMVVSVALLFVLMAYMTELAGLRH